MRSRIPYDGSRKRGPKNPSYCFRPRQNSRRASYDRNMHEISIGGRSLRLGIRPVGRWPGNNPVLVSNLAVIAIVDSVSVELVRNIIFDELLRVDRLAPISVNQVHGHSIVNLIIQQIIAPAIDGERRVSKID